MVGGCDRRKSTGVRLERTCTWNLRWFAGQETVTFERLLETSPSVDNVVFETLAANAHSDFATLFGADLEFYFFSVVDENSVSSRGQVEGNVFVGLLRRGTSICSIESRSAGITRTRACEAPFTLIPNRVTTSVLD